MSKRPSFIPGRPAASQPPLAHYRPQQPMGAVEGYVRSLTDPGGLVVDLFCQGSRFVEEALEGGCRVLGFSINPLLLLVARLGLIRLDRQALDAGFTRLADSSKGDEILRSHLASLYRTRCPVCHTSGVAEWFAWHRDLDRPFEKKVRCRSCGKAQTGPTDEDDVAQARSFAPRGLPYYYALDRAAPLKRQASDPGRERAAELVECYTPRNLSALMDLSRRLESVEAADGVRIALMGALLDCFDRCSKLYPHGEDRPRPRTLRIPVRYLERNVWFCFEEGLSSLPDGRPTSVTETEDVDELLRGTTAGDALVPRAARDVGEILPVKGVDLVLVDPPRPDGVFWALSALWAAWLWDSSDARAMRPFLRRRRFDWHWHWRVLREALRKVGPRLTEEGLLVMLFKASDRAMLPSVCLAAASAGYRPRTWGYAPEIGYRLTWGWEGLERPPSAVTEALEKEAVAEIEGAAVRTLRRRSEPTQESLLHAASHLRLADRDLLRAIAALEQEASPIDLVADVIDRGLDAAPIICLKGGGKQPDGLWWLLHPRKTLDAFETLADRVEASVRELLAERLVWPDSDLVNAVYARFPSLLTPELDLVTVCIASYGVSEGREIHLRPEDDFERRRREIETIRDDLVALGQRLGFQVTEDGVGNVRWREDEGEAYVFTVSATAVLTPFLLDESAQDSEGQRCLVIPGGRARLIHLKLQRDPRLARVVDSGTWQFIKFRHLRRLVAEEDLDRYAFKIVLGLDPIAERELTQLPLF